MKRASYRQGQLRGEVLLQFIKFIDDEFGLHQVGGGNVRFMTEVGTARCISLQSWQPCSASLTARS